MPGKGGLNPDINYLGVLIEVFYHLYYHIIALLIEEISPFINYLWMSTLEALCRKNNHKVFKGQILVVTYKL